MSNKESPLPVNPIIVICRNHTTVKHIEILMDFIFFD